MSDNPLEPLVVRPKVAQRLIGCGNTRFYELLAIGELESYKDGKSRLITMASIKARVARMLAEANTRLVPQTSSVTCGGAASAARITAGRRKHARAAAR
jgi:hypothetical protein